MKKILLMLACVISVFISKAQAPTFQWAKQIGDADWDSGNSIAVDALGNVYTTGSFNSTVDFDPGPGIFTLTTSGSGINDDVFVSKLDASGNFVWAKQFGSTNYDIGFCIVVDGSGNSYTTGKFMGTVDFDPGPGVFNLTCTGSEGVFICKLDAAGNFVWAKSMSGNSQAWGYSLALDLSGNVYTSGFFANTVDFDPGSSVFNLTANGSRDIFISKLDASGNFLWAKSIGGTGDDYGQSIAIDGTGNVYTTGQFRYNVDFDPGAGIFNINSPSTPNIYVNKLDPLGNFLWAKSFASTGFCTGSGIAIDGAGNVCTTGYYGGATDFDPGVGTYTLTHPNSAAYVSKLDAAGNFIFVKEMAGGSTTSCISNSIKIHPSTNNIYTTGRFTYTVDFDPGAGVYNLTSNANENSFISILNSFGNFIWAGSLISTGTCWGKSIDTDLSGNIYTTGIFSTLLDCDPGIGVVNLNPLGQTDIYIHKLSAGTLDAEALSTKQSQLLIYPNPSDGSFVLELSNSSIITITNPLGQIIFQDRKEEGKHLIDLRKEANGIYFINITNIENRSTVKIIKN